jgi:penicillin-binding protein 1A
MAQRSRSARIALILGGLAVVGVAAGWTAFYLLFLRELPDLRSLRDYRPLLSSRVYARDGRPIGEFYDERRFLVALEEVPPQVVHAFVASEDAAFFEHEGLDYQGILRAAWKNLAAGGEIRQGGSTITQQVAKSLLLSPERRFTRKLKDMLLARRIEQRFSKEQILFLYLNQIYFGHGAYGIGEAARSYFGVATRDLSVSQGALLAGLPRAPSAYSPHRNPEAAERRRSYVLGQMRDEGYLDEAAYQEALAAPPLLADPPEAEDMRTAAWFVEEVRRQLFEILGGETVRRDGLVIETTLDLDLQRASVEALRKGLKRIDHRQGYRGPLRQVGADALETAQAELSIENGLAVAEGEAPLEAVPVDTPLLAVVTQVEAKRDVARVAFAPGLEGEVLLADVKWAREPNPARYPVPMRSIAKIFQVGDVARFVRPTPGEKDAAADPPRVVLHQEPAIEGASFSFEVDSGEVLALVGGYDFERSEFNRVLQARRQPGSAFKPLIYTAALQQGLTPTSIIVDRPLVYEDPESGFVWRPGNYKGRFLGKLTLRAALARSVNNATIHLLNEIGVSHALELSRKLGIESPLDRNLSLALGTSGVSLLELTRAYAVFPARGRVVVPVYIRRVLDAEGNVLLERVPLGGVPENAVFEGWTPDADADAEEPVVAEAQPAAPAPPPAAAKGEVEEEPLPPGYALSEVDAYLAVDMLHAVVTEKQGTGKQARALKRPLGGKTGTTNEQGDAWFVGFSPDVATGVWVGFDERRVLGKGETGGKAALPIWVEVMRAALAPRPRRNFVAPDGIVYARVDRESGLLAGPGSKDSYFQAYAEGTAPTETSDGAVHASESDRMLRLDRF